MKDFNLQMKRAKESKYFFGNKRDVGEEALKNNEVVILKFVNIPSDTISPNEMHKVSSASTSNTIPEVEKETTPGQISNSEETDVESNITS